MLIPPKNEYSETELMSLVHDWQDEPQKYSKLLIEQVYVTLYKMCNQEIDRAVKDNLEIETSASSLVNEVYLKVPNGLCKKNPLESLKTFYYLIRRVIRNVLLDRFRKKIASKRMIDSDFYRGVERRAQEINSEFVPGDLRDFDASLLKLKSIEPDAAEAISIRVYNCKTVEQIAAIMELSRATVERLISEGKKLLNALVNGVEIGVN